MQQSLIAPRQSRHCYELGLVLTGTATTTLADGSSSYALTALGTASVGTEENVGTFLLNPDPSNVLIGVEFLNTFKSVFAG
jgi:hypothetical protein